MQVANQSLFPIPVILEFESHKRKKEKEALQGGVGQKNE